MLRPKSESVNALFTGEGSNDNVGFLWLKLQAQRASEQADQTDDDQVNRDNEIQQLGHDENEDASNQ